jgi:hypothetical protein
MEMDMDGIDGIHHINGRHGALVNSYMKHAHVPPHRLHSPGHINGQAEGLISEASPSAGSEEESRGYDGEDDGPSPPGGTGSVDSDFVSEAEERGRRDRSGRMPSLRRSGSVLVAVKEESALMEV